MANYSSGQFGKHFVAPTPSSSAQVVVSNFSLRLNKKTVVAKDDRLLFAHIPAGYMLVKALVVVPDLDSGTELVMDYGIFKKDLSDHAPDAYYAGWTAGRAAGIVHTANSTLIEQVNALPAESTVGRAAGVVSAPNNSAFLLPSLYRETPAGGLEDWVPRVFGAKVKTAPAGDADASKDKDFYGWIEYRPASSQDCYTPTESKKP